MATDAADQRAQLRLVELREAYAAELPNRVERIDALLQQVERDRSQMHLVEDVARAVHGITGSGATFGFPEVSRRARALEENLAAVLSGAAETLGLREVMVARDLLDQLIVATRDRGDVAAASGDERGLERELARVSRPPDEAEYRVLIVDDDPLSAEHHAVILRAAGAAVDLVSDPSMAPRSIEQFEPEVVVMDLYMPGHTGAEVTGFIRDLIPSSALPIVYLSAETNVRRQLEALSAGGEDFLAKPVDPDELIAIVFGHARRLRDRERNPS